MMDMIKHLESRKYEVNRYKQHFIDQENEIATFYLFDETGKFTGYQKYNPNSTIKNIDNSEDEGRYFNKNKRGELTVWGMETLTRQGPLFVTESIFKAAAIHKAGFNAITQLCAGCSERFLKYVDWLDMPTYFIGDFDQAGLKFSKYRPNGFITKRDLDEYTTEELRQILDSKISPL